MSATNTSTAVWGMLAERWRKTITAGFRADTQAAATKVAGLDRRGVRDRHLRQAP
jgi:hypothetical protein